MEPIKFEYVGVDKDPETNMILGHAGFIKAIEDLYEAMVDSVPGIKFGIALSEVSSDCLVRSEGNDPVLIKQAEEGMMKISVGHTFLILMKSAYPINVMSRLKAVPEIANIYCATANPLQIIVGKSDQGRAIFGVIDGSSPRGVEQNEDRAKRKKLLRDLGYKL